MKRILEYNDLQPVIDKLLRDRESNEIEFKSAAGGFPGSFWETYSSFANTHGGAIILGVKERDNSFFLDGLTEEQTKKYQRDFFNNMHSSLQYALNMHRADITLMLGKMCDDKLLVSTGHGRGTKYQINNPNIALPGDNIALPDDNIALPGDNIALPDDNIALPDDNIALKKRYTKEEMKSMVLEVCQDWKTVEEIANYVGRTPGYMKNMVLPQLHDVIEKMYDISHHPRQKYRAKQKK